MTPFSTIFTLKDWRLGDVTKYAVGLAGTKVAKYAYRLDSLDVKIDALSTQCFSLYEENKSRIYLVGRLKIIFFLA